MAKKEDESHSEGMLIKEFCTQRMEKCTPCGNKYADIVDKDPDIAVSFKFPRLINKETGVEKQDISQNAHHVVCVAEVTKIISKDEDLQKVLENTKYCVNASINMMALPLFAHTVYWYLIFDEAAPRTQTKTFLTAGAPPFENLPNHDFDHGRYNREVCTELEQIKGRVNQAAHKLKPEKLVKELEDLSVHFKKQLTARGRRGKMTHGNWLEACNGNIEGWYEPFSLAEDPAPRGFPTKVKKNRDRLEKAIQFLLNQ